MTPAVIEAAAVPCAVASPSPREPDYAAHAAEICNKAALAHLWKNRELTTYEFRYAARRSDDKAGLARKYREEIETYLPHFTKTHGPIRADDFEIMPCFIAQCAACYSYLIALDNGNRTALCFDNKTDKVWVKHMELKEIEARIEELQNELDEAESEYDRLERELESAEKAEKKGGAK